MIDTMEITTLEPLARLSRDLKAATVTLGPREARFLVDLFYQVQDYRIEAGGQERTLEEGKEPHEIITWVGGQVATLENDIKRALGAYAASTVPGRWMLGITGIGPVISAGMLAHIDITQAPTVGHIWRFAGLDPTSKWLGKAGAAQVVAAVRPDKKQPLTAEMVVQAAELAGRKPDRLAVLAEKHGKGEITPASLEAVLAKRPWNAGFKVLCWKTSQSFMKFQNNPNDFYGKLYVQRKQYEIERNESGQLAEQAAAVLAAKRIGKDTEAYKAYSVGKLPPAHIDARARRWVVKLFLAHAHAVMYYDHYKTMPPKPYVLEHVGGHVHEITCPNWPF